MHYRVTILNSPAVNAFALPSGQLYVTRGLIALANDTSELASVLSHEMSHVIARHAAIREDQARQVALVSRVVNDVLSDPRAGALALAKSKIELASFSRAQEFEADGIGVGIAGARRIRSVRRRRAFSPRWAAMPSCKASPAAHIDPRAPDFLSSHPATPERIKNAQANARQFSGARRAASATRQAYLAGIDGMVYGEDPSEGFVRGRRFLHPKLGFTFLAPEGFTLDNTAQAVLGVGTAAARRCGSTWCACRPSRRSPNISSPAGSRTSTRRAWRRSTINGFPAATATAKGDQWLFRLYAVRFGSDVYRFIFAAKRMTRGGRSRVPRVGRQLPPHDAGGKPGGKAAAHQGRDGRSRRHGRAPGGPHGARRPSGRALPHAQRLEPRRAA